MLTLKVTDIPETIQQWIAETRQRTLQPEDEVMVMHFPKNDPEHDKSTQDFHERMDRRARELEEVAARMREHGMSEKDVDRVLSMRYIARTTKPKAPRLMRPC